MLTYENFKRIVLYFVDMVNSFDGNIRQKGIDAQKFIYKAYPDYEIQFKREMLQRNEK